MGAGERIWLTGLMGAGKTTVGRLLAAELGCPYLDNDTELERRTGRALRDWPPGEALHHAEDETLRAMLAEPGPFVAGVPAGTADRSALLSDVRASGVLVHLHAAPAVLEARVEGTGRPLGPDVRATLEGQYAHRDPVYSAAADLVVDGRAGVLLAVRQIRDLLDARTGVSGTVAD